MNTMTKTAADAIDIAFNELVVTSYRGCNLRRVSAGDEVGRDTYLGADFDGRPELRLVIIVGALNSSHTVMVVDDVNTTRNADGTRSPSIVFNAGSVKGEALYAALDAAIDAVAGAKS